MNLEAIRPASALHCGGPMRTKRFATLSLFLAAACSNAPEEGIEGSSPMRQDMATPGSDASNAARDASHDVSASEGKEDAGSQVGQIMPCDTAGVMALFDLGGSPDQCGTLAHTSSLKEQTAAKTCMDDAVVARRPFRLTFTTAGADAYLTTTMFGVVPADGTYAVYVIHDGPGQWDRTQWGACKGLPPVGCDGDLRTCATCDWAMECSCTPRENDAVRYECMVRE